MREEVDALNDDTISYMCAFVISVFMCSHHGKCIITIYFKELMGVSSLVRSLYLVNVHFCYNSFNIYNLQYDYKWIAMFLVIKSRLTVVNRKAKKEQHARVS